MTVHLITADQGPGSRTLCCQMGPNDLAASAQYSVQADECDCPRLERADEPAEDATDLDRALAYLDEHDGRTETRERLLRSLAGKWPDGYLVNVAEGWVTDRYNSERRR